MVYLTTLIDGINGLDALYCYFSLNLGGVLTLQNHEGNFVKQDSRENPKVSKLLKQLLWKPKELRGTLLELFEAKQ